MNFHDNRTVSRSTARQCADIALGLAVAALLLHGCDAPASAASLARSTAVDAFASADETGLAALKTPFERYRNNS
jgi:hypothetical protein